MQSTFNIFGGGYLDNPIETNRASAALRREALA